MRMVAPPLNPITARHAPMTISDDLIAQARKFAQEHLAPRLADGTVLAMDAALCEAAAAHGLMGISVPAADRKSVV